MHPILYGSKAVSNKIIDKTPPVAPTVNKVSSKSTVVSGRAEVGSTVTVYSGSKLIGKAVVNSKGTYSVKIKSQKKGSSLKMYATDNEKNKSQVRVVQVQ